MCLCAQEKCHLTMKKWFVHRTTGQWQKTTIVRLLKESYCLGMKWLSQPTERIPKKARYNLSMPIQWTPYTSPVDKALAMIWALSIYMCWNHVISCNYVCSSPKKYRNVQKLCHNSCGFLRFYLARVLCMCICIYHHVYIYIYIFNDIFIGRESHHCSY